MAAFSKSSEDTNIHSGAANQKTKADNAGSTALPGGLPSIALPKSGGAIKSIDDKFQVNAANGTAGFSIPFPFSPSRNSFMPSLGLRYNSGAGNGVFGLGWNAEPISISRKTEKKLPEYNDADESDVFIFSGAEDLVPAFARDGSGNWIKEESADGLIKRYKPRIEAGFARIERIKETNGNIYWKVTSKENIVSIFGKSKSAQVFDPKDETKIFKWLFEFSYDDKGNCYQFEYVKENQTNVPNELHEKNRLNVLSACTNAYLKRIKYCNKEHLDRNEIHFNDWENTLNGISYLLELVLDYGEHSLSNPKPNDDNGWAYRHDAFSDYRAGFEIRTWRLCNRVLMFHHFEELPNGPCLVRSLDIKYEPQDSNSFSFLTAVTQRGYIWRGASYSHKSLPPVEFTYEQLGWDTTVKTLPKESLENLPVGIDDQSYQWIDLYSEGISGILTEQSNGWYYKSNSGDGIFDGLKLVSPKPSLSGLNTGAVHFQDVEANGQKHLVSNDLNGFFEFTPENEWLPFKKFNEVPKIDLRDPNVKMLDLNGDGKADILISEENIFTWYPSKGKDGFENYRTSLKTFDEEKGPNIVFADSTQSIVLADMSGDGLADIVRIRNNDIVYWPNLGYGKFGAKVSMSNAPVFDQPDHFNPQYLKLADLDGSGTTGIVYLAKDSFKIYFNQAGNRWSDENIVQGVNPIPFSKMDDHANVNIIDLLGNGTGCIVWSSPLPAHSENPLRYIDLMAGKKPHVMISYKNNMGKECFMQYKPSTYFYLKDKEDGTPWMTKLPFPVQCVSEVIAIDQVRKTRFTNQYSYHHGYYDYKEREFRGFGRVDQTDTEDFENYKKNTLPGDSIQLADERFYEPPILSKTWYHTGAFLDNEKILDQFAHEYYQNEIVPEKKLNEPALPADWSTGEWREALRACKGMPLHVETYSIDGTDKQDHPYTTAQHTCFIERLQPTLENKNAIFLVLESEALTYTYERNPADPRIAHSMNIEVDEFGNVLKAAAISYGRKTVDADLTETEQAEQNKTHIIFTENNISNKIDIDTDYRLPVAYQTKTYELTGISPASENYFQVDEIKNEFQNAETIAYEILPTAEKKEKRLIEHVRSLFLGNDLVTVLPAGTMQSLALPYQVYKLALTKSLVQNIFADKVNDTILLDEGNYFAEDDNYWITSGTQTFDAANFYQVIEIADPFGYKGSIIYDNDYRFYIQQVMDELENKTEVAAFNFRLLSAYIMQDMNDNRTGIRADELGMVMSSFVMGKLNENKGDFFDTGSIEATDADRPSGKMIYDLFNYSDNGKPNFVKADVNETHYFESLATGKPVITQTSYSYSDGSGNEIMRKVQAEPGIALQENENGTVTEVDTGSAIRWIGNGRTILNNKGKPVKQYEPYFSTTPEYEDSKLLVERGVTPIIYYDAAGRVIKTEMPDGTFSKVEFDSWMQKAFDPNDTVLESQWYKDRIIEPVAGFSASETDAANKAASHANTPAVSYLDSFGRNFLSIADNGTGGKYKTFVETDIEGNVRKITDARGNAVIQYKYGILGNQLYSLSMDAGERWGIADVMGKPMYSWDNRNHVFSFKYDELHRPLSKKINGGDGLIPLNNVFEQIIYGNADSDKERNLRAKPVIVYDTAGKMETIEADFKGNSLSSSRTFNKNYKDVPNWNNEANDNALEVETFFTSSAFDALNRITSQVAADNSIYIPTYNEANLLELVTLIQNENSSLFVKGIDYNEKGQRNKIVYGNDITTTYEYDKKTFRLTHLQTKRLNNDPLQDLYYSFDPVGNITRIEDKNIPITFFNNQKTEGINDYTYDAIYQLKEAIGREHIAQVDFGGEDNWNDLPFLKQYNAGDEMAMRAYKQKYNYDAVGNILQMIHEAGTGSWTRDYTPAENNNRLLSTKVGEHIYEYPHHEQHGFITSMPHLQMMQWNFKEELQAISKQRTTTEIPEITYYVYDGSGQRARKITERQSAAATTPSKKSERIYVAGVEFYREYDTSNTITLERQTCHVMDDKSRIAMIETRTHGTDDAPGKLVRYQFGNHLGSANIETDDEARVISYEEYHPFGTTSYQALNKEIKTAAKRYRYTGMERDEESGLEYHSARYYLAWLGRWLSADPAELKDGINVYCYTHNNSIYFHDRKGSGSETDIVNDVSDYVQQAGHLDESLRAELSNLAQLQASQEKIQAYYESQYGPANNLPNPQEAEIAASEARITAMQSEALGLKVRGAELAAELSAKEAELGQTLAGVGEGPYASLSPADALSSARGTIASITKAANIPSASNAATPVSPESGESTPPEGESTGGRISPGEISSGSTGTLSLTEKIIGQGPGVMSIGIGLFYGHMLTSAGDDAKAMAIEYLGDYQDRLGDAEDIMHSWNRKPDGPVLPAGTPTVPAYPQKPKVSRADDAKVKLSILGAKIGAALRKNQDVVSDEVNTEPTTSGGSYLPSLPPQCAFMPAYLSANPFDYEAMAWEYQYCHY